MSVFVKLRVKNGSVQVLRGNRWEFIPSRPRVPHVERTNVPGMTMVIEDDTVFVYEHDNIKYELQLEEGRLYKCGPSYGYRVKTPCEEADPVLRVARRIGIPVTRVAPSQDSSVVKLESNEYVTDGIVSDGRVRNFTYIVELLKKKMPQGQDGRFVQRISRSRNVDATHLEEVLQDLNLKHRPEWKGVSGGCC